MTTAYVVGVASTAFRRAPERTFHDLAREAVLGALADAGLGPGGPRDAPAVDAVWFGNCGLGTWGQQNIRGQVVLGPLVRAGALPERAPIVNVEGGCATGSLALHAAWKDVLSGDSGLALAVGVEKVFRPEDPASILRMFDGGADQLDPDAWRRLWADAAEACGRPFAPDPRRIVFLDTAAALASRHMKRFGTTARQLAAVASKNHGHGALNPKAQHREAMTPEAVLADKEALAPLTRSMCAPVSDGAAAVLVCRQDALDRLPERARERAVRLRGGAIASGRVGPLDACDVIRAAGERAWARAGLGPGDVHVAELHDATAFAELHALEQLGFAREGEGGALAEAGHTRLGGRLPINPSGGLESKGHPLAATGLGMIEELVLQLRGEAGPRQVAGARVALAQNAGGLVGFEEALCAVTILERA
jgi:acetyl-CoA acetyltransferase